MNTTTCPALIFSEDEQQRVEIEYTYQRISRFFEPVRISVVEVVILTPLEITSGDLYEDVQTAIAHDLGVAEIRVGIECEIEEAVEKEMMFV